MRTTFTSITEHASTRLQQRAISSDDVERVLTYGRRVRVHGAMRCFMDQTARWQLLKAEGAAALKRAANKLDIFGVVSDAGALVTAGYRTRRVKVP